MAYILLISLLFCVPLSLGKTSVQASWCRSWSIGKSVQERDLSLTYIGRGEHGEDSMRPYVRWVANMDGNEIVGRHLLQRLIDEMCDPSAYDYWRPFIEGLHIFVVPTMNPDGYENHARRNANGHELNRNFPELRFPGSEKRKDRVRQPETLAMMQFDQGRPFGLCANMHGGTLVANYPFDSSHHRVIGRGRPHPQDRTQDDTMFHEIARIYSSHHPRMNHTSAFNDGTTLGADWYVIYGSMQDWIYLATSCYGITLEVSTRKSPSVETIDDYWNENKASIEAFMRRALVEGVQGVHPDGESDVVISFTCLDDRTIHHKDIITFPPDGRFYTPLLANHTWSIKSSDGSIEREIVIYPGDTVVSI